MISRVLVGTNTEIQEHTMRRKQEVGLMHTFHLISIVNGYKQQTELPGCQCAVIVTHSLCQSPVNSQD